MHVFRTSLLIRPAIAVALLAAAIANAQESSATNSEKSPATPLTSPAAVPAQQPLPPELNAGAELRGFSPGEVSRHNFETAPDPNALPVPGQPQSRVQPANADALRNNPAASSRSAAYSQNWLLDGVNRLEAEQRMQRVRAQAGRNELTDADLLSEGGDGVKGRAATTTATDAVEVDDESNLSKDKSPLAEYLQKWVSPTSVPPVTAEISTTSVALENPAVNASRYEPRVAQVEQAQSLQGLDLTRPDLDASGPRIVLPPPPPVADAVAAQAALASANALVSSSDPSGVPDNKQLTVKKYQPELDLTKPIVNDKKYFPQLQRF